MNAEDVKKLIITIIEIVLIGAIICAAINILNNIGMAEDCWVMCRPGTEGKPNEVLIREKPGRRKAVVGAVSCGTQLETDGKQKAGWVHVINLANETGEGWISAEYVVFDQPYRIDGDGVIKGRGRVACRSSMNGKRSGWIQPGEMVTVYWISEDWAVTDRGYISTKYLEVP